ncbi:uncharacterized protein [Penaeus vannamei]|uniref:uncharacterized protein n=1 Tax=Penaeus vannamei TaxID=6689 RepID=UPI00387FA406
MENGRFPSKSIKEENIYSRFYSCVTTRVQFRSISKGDVRRELYHSASVMYDSLAVEVNRYLQRPKLKSIFRRGINGITIHRVFAGPGLRYLPERSRIDSWRVYKGALRPGQETVQGELWHLSDTRPICDFSLRFSCILGRSQHQLRVNGMHLFSEMWTMWSHLLLFIVAGQCSLRLSNGQRLIEDSPTTTTRLGLKSSCLNPDLIDAVMFLLKTDQPSSNNNVHLVFQHQTDECLIAALWREGVAARVMTSSYLEEDLTRTTYYLHSQRILVGDVTWITQVLQKAKVFYTSNQLNLQRTHWFWVITSSSSSKTGFPLPGDNKSSQLDPKHKNLTSLHPANTNVTSLDPEFTNLTILTSLDLPGGENTSKASYTFQKLMEKVSGFLVEGIRGVLIFMPELDLDASSRQESWVSVGGIKTSGDGSWSMRLVASWSAAGAKILDTIWPRPSFDLKGRMVRMSCLRKPTVFEFPDGVGAGGLAEAQGYAAVLMREFQQLLNFSDVLVPTDTFGTEQPDGSWTGMVGALTKFEADIAPLDFTPVYERALVVDFSVIYNTDNVIILTKAPSVAIRPFLLLQIFSPFVWLSLFVVTVTSGAVIGWLLRARSTLGLKKELGLRSVPAYCAAALKMIIFNGSTCWPVWSGGRIVSGAIMFLAVVAGALYGGSVTAFLAIPFRTKPLNSLEDLVASDTLPAFRFGASPYNFFVKQTEGVLGEVSRRMKIFSGDETAEWSFMKTVADGTHAFIDTWSSVVGRANLYEERGQPCRFHLGRNPVRMDLDAFAFPKNSPIQYQFDEIMRWFRSYGIIQNVMKKYFAKSCDLLYKVDGPRPLSLIQTQGAFYVMAVGISVSFAAFVGEFIPFKAFARFLRFPPKKA